MNDFKDSIANFWKYSVWSESLDLPMYSNHYILWTLGLPTNIVPIIVYKNWGWFFEWCYFVGHTYSFIVPTMIYLLCIVCYYLSNLFAHLQQTCQPRNVWLLKPRNLAPTLDIHVYWWKISPRNLTLSLCRCNQTQKCLQTNHKPFQHAQRRLVMDQLYIHTRTTLTNLLSATHCYPSC